VSTVFDDFSGNTPPTAPSGWTPVNYGSWTVVTANESGNIIVVDDEAGGNRVHFLVHTATGSIADASAQELEVVTKWRFRTGETPGANFLACLLVQSTDGSNLGAYVFGPSSATTCRGFIRSSVGGTGTLGGTTDQNLGFTLSANTWYWTRWRRETNGIFRGRIWADGSAEPSTWQWESGSANTTLTTGYIGIGGNSASAESDFDLIGLGIGQSAPTSAGGPGNASGALASATTSAVAGSASSTRSTSVTLVDVSGSPLDTVSRRFWTRKNLQDAAADGGAGGLAVTCDANGVFNLTGLTVLAGDGWLTYKNAVDDMTAHTVPVTFV
jgi:hypothetical protein